MSYVDDIFKDNCGQIMSIGVSTEGQEVRPIWDDGEPAHTLSIFGVMNKYDIGLGLPLSTLRWTNWKAAIDEILWIWQKKSNRLEDLNSKIWDQWGDEDGTIGLAYGFQMGKPFKYKGEWTDQTDYVLNFLKSHSVDRGIITNLYNHQDLDEMNLRPCVHSTQWSVREGKLDLMLIQRSQDTIVANNWNIVQYAALMMMFAQVSNLEPGILTHVIGDMHIYDRHIPIAHELIKRDAHLHPTTVLNPSVRDFYKFKVEDFQVYDYKCGRKITGIPVAK